MGIIKPVRNRGGNSIDGDSDRFEKTDSTLPWKELKTRTSQPLNCQDCLARIKRRCAVINDTIDAHGSCVATEEQIKEYVEIHGSLRRS